MKKTSLASADFKNKLLVSVLLVVFIVLILFVYLNSYYVKKMDSLNKEIFPTLNMNSFSVVSAQKPLNLPQKYKKFGGVFFMVKPGDVLKKQLLIKNHDADSAHFYNVKFIENDKYDLDGSEIVEGYEGVLPDLVFDTPNLKLDPEGVGVLDYKITVPSDIENGVYKLFLQTKAVDEKAAKMDQGGGVIFDVAIGTKIYLVVQDEPVSLLYKDLTLQAKELSRPWVYVKLGYIVGVGFAVLTVFFLYMAFKYDRIEGKKGK